MLEFERPLLLIFVFLPALLALILRRLGHRRESRLPFSLTQSPSATSAVKAEAEAPIPDFRPPQTLALALASACAFFSRFFFWLGLLILCALPSGPALRSTQRLYLDRGQDLIFILDSSPSMTAMDTGLSRFESCRQIMRDFALAGGNSSLGLVAFGTEAALIVPPTENREFFLKRLDALEAGALGDGTALGMGMATALYHLRSSRAPSRMAVVFTDGENNCGEISPERAASLAREAKVALVMIGIGSRGEVLVSWTDPRTGKIMEGRYASDFDESRLEKLAMESGGSFYLARDEAGLKRVKAQILRAAAPLGRSRETTRSSSLVFPLLSLALLALILGFLFECVFTQEASCP